RSPAPTAAASPASAAPTRRQTTAEPEGDPGVAPPTVAVGDAAPPRGGPAVATSEPDFSDSALDGGVFVKTVRVGAGLTLELQGIAWSDTHPVALINGNAIGVGEGMGGFLVHYISRDHVELRSDEAAFELRLR
ncbi:MAG: hypothetical protein R3190_14325, partial [Thermoanaerobaculia bacterium]|nr:hypothetical protein [Thermoanaerobaculia bacterium]